MAENRSRYSRSKKGNKRRRYARERKSFYDSFRVDPSLKNSFKKIGIPERAPFKPDPFQLEALEMLNECDVLVSAPTGSGKTWIATQAIERNLKNNLRTWYASPLKALSNSLYQQFIREFGPSSCGILTGERKENTDAPVIVGTTEILRNQLYDKMHEGTDLESDLVILDEAHYLSDPDRGVVWEEVLIYLPSRIRLLLLSATVSNAEEISGWLMKNRGVRTHVIRSHERPVPLKRMFLFPDGLLSPLSGKKGLSPKVKKYVSSHRVNGKMRGEGKPRFGEIIFCLREYNLLPAIFFLKSRMDCDNALALCDHVDKKDLRRPEIRNAVKEFLKDYPHLEGHRHLRSLTESLVASHHAGQLPYWKVLIEMMMNRGYLDAIFSTSTVAAGVNFPARTVVLLQSDRFNGRAFSDLTATDLHQMTGRAGRRGMDNIGFVLVIPGLHQDPQLIQKLMDSPPEPLVSQIGINFSMALNLLLSHVPDDIRILLELSFAKYQQKNSETWMSNLMDGILDTLGGLLKGGNCDNSDPFEVMELINERNDLKKERRRLKKLSPGTAQVGAIKPFLEKGRMFRASNGSDFILLKKYMYRGRLVCAALDIGRKVRMKKGRLRLRKVSPEKIEFLYDRRVDIPDENDMKAVQEILDMLEFEEREILEIQSQPEDRKQDAVKVIETKIERLPCNNCEVLDVCNVSRNKPLRKALRDFSSISHMIDGVSDTLWINFRRHLRFLKETGYVDENDRLTSDGVWASKLRLDHPLLIAEAIKRGGFNGISPEVMAGLIALFVWDRTQEVETRLGSIDGLEIMEEAFNRLMMTVEEIVELMERRDFETPRIMFWPAAALFQWTRGISWEMLFKYIPIGEGDMASLIVRTADHLRQVANLRETHPELAETARKAMNLMLREPVFLE